jgi:ribosomal protein L11 methyltransferase
MKEMPEALKKEKWLEIILTTPSELVEPLSNFITELGTDGIIEEELDLGSFKEKPGPASEAELKAYLPWGSEAKKQIGFLKKYIINLSKTFPKLEKPTFTTNTITDPDWGEQWKKYFKPLKISKNIVIKPTWERYAPLGRDIVIDIDPGMAFGTGQHPSTRMCIIALEDILTHNRGIHDWKALDVGTGTGILAISCAKLGIKNVVAVDLDPQAIEIAGKNIAINGVANRIEIINRDIAMCKGTFDLIVANLTANALISLRPHLVRMTKADGYMILSGIIEQDATSIETLFESKDITIHDTLTEKEWVCYVLKKRSKAR